MALKFLNNGVFSGDVTINGGHLKLLNHSGAYEGESSDYLYIGGSGLDNNDAAIYLGNAGNDTGYGWRFYYEGSGGGNNNKLIIKSENAGSGVNALAFTQDGNATFIGSVSGITPTSSANFTTKAYVDAHTSGVQVINEGVGIKKSGTSTNVTISANYDSADSDNLMWGATAYSAGVASKPYTPYILVADSNPGISYGQVKNIRIQSIPLDRFAEATSTIDMGGNKILQIGDPSLAKDAANKSYVDQQVGNYVPLAGGTMTGVLSIPSLITHAGNTTTSFGFNANNQYDVIIAGQAKLRVNSTKIETFNQEITTSGSPQYFTYGGSGSQELHFRSNGPGGTKSSIIAKADGGVKLYYNNDLKLETVSGGVTLGNNSLRLGQYSAIDLNGVGPSAGKVITGTGTSSQLQWNDSVANINTGDGLMVSSSTSNGATTKFISLDFPGLADTDGEDPGIQAFIVLDNEDENSKLDLQDVPNVDTHWKTTQTIITSNFDDRSSSTSIWYMPLNYISETTSANYYNTFACPTSGKIKRIRMMHTAGSTMSTFFTTELSILKNGGLTTSSGELTPSNGANDGSAIVWTPGGGGYSFNNGDRLNFRYQKSGTGKYWYGVSVSIVVEFDNII